MITLTEASGEIQKRKGSALLVTLLVVSLLLLMVLAFSTYVRMELRNVSNHQAARKAQAHAVLGLHLGLARLQETAGPDQRATATASTVPHPDASAGNPRPGTGYWSGVWQAGPSQRSDGREPQPVLLDWLVSGRETATSSETVTPGQYQSGLQSDGQTVRSDEVVLVGSGSLGHTGNGSGVSPELYVVAPRVHAAEDLAYAYWVGDENVKARINLHDDAPDNTVDALRRFFAPKSAPVNAMADLESLPRFDDRWERLVSVPGLSLMYPDAAPWLKRNFHQASLHAASVLSDPLRGGLKRDLSLAFELEDAQFNRSEFALAMSPGDPVRTNINQSFSNKAVFAERDPALYQFDSGANPNVDYLAGPTWHYLRDFYRLYKEADPSTGALSSRPMSPNRQASGNSNPNSFIKSFTVPNIGYDNDSNALRQRHGTQTKVLPTGVEVHPEFQRLILLFGLAEINGVVHLVVEPMAVVHNPYNVPVEMSGMMGTWTNLDQAIRVETFYPGAGDGNEITPHEPEYNGNFWAGGGMELGQIIHGEGSDTTFTFLLTESGTGSSGPVRFEPGEIKYFTTGLSGTEVVSPGDVKIFRLREGLNPNTLFQGYGYAYPLEYTRRLPVGPPWFQHGPMVMPPGGTVFGRLIPTPGPHGGTRVDQPGIGSQGDLAGGPREFGGLHLYHIRQNQLNDNFENLFFDTQGSPLYIRPHTQRHMIPYADLRELRLWPSELVGGQFWRSGQPKRRFNEAELQRVMYFAANDLYLKPINDDQTRSSNINPFEVFTHHNPRAPIGVPWESGGRGVNGTRIVHTWNAHNRHLEDGRPDGVIGTGLDGRRGLWGDGLFAQEGGTESVVLYETPRQPMLNMQQLGQANLSFWSHQPMFALGNSRASPYIERDRVWHGSPVTGNVVSFQFDNAYLLNEALWDGYFFSGVTGWNGPNAPSDALGTALENFVDDPASIPFANPRMRLLQREVAHPGDLGLDLSEYSAPQSPASPLRPHNRMAQHVLLEGGFNVNSTSVDVWKAMLSGLSGQGAIRVNANGQLNLEPENDGILPFGSHGAYLGGTSPGEAYSGHRPLNSQEVDQLANAIVLEIQERIAARGGPFLSMAEFVNRRLIPGGDAHASQGMAGVLQAAIDRVDALNRDVEDDWGIETNLDDFFRHNGNLDEVRVPYVAPEAFGETTRRGMSRHLDQRAILSAIGAAATVRSDTFRIRAYGSNIGDPNTPGAAEAWCEAIVQRIPDFVDPADDAASSLANVNPINQRFGRQYRIVSFRWLNPEDL